MGARLRRAARAHAQARPQVSPVKKDELRTGRVRCHACGSEATIGAFATRARAACSARCTTHKLSRSGEKEMPSLDLVGYTALHAAAMQPHNEGACRTHGRSHRRCRRCRRLTVGLLWLTG